jgi:hypothetical protein
MSFISLGNFFWNSEDQDIQNGVAVDSYQMKSGLLLKGSDIFTSFTFSNPCITNKLLQFETKNMHTILLYS